MTTLDARQAPIAFAGVTLVVQCGDAACATPCDDPIALASATRHA
jgi:hypothetical protein